jgi:chromosome segregation ATPase
MASAVEALEKKVEMLKAQLDEAKSAVQAARFVDKVLGVEAAQPKQKKRKLSAEGRKRIQEAQRRRHAEPKKGSDAEELEKRLDGIAEQNEAGIPA